MNPCICAFVVIYVRSDVLIKMYPRVTEWRHSKVFVPEIDTHDDEMKDFQTCIPGNFYICT